MNNIIQNKKFYLKEQKGATLVEFAIIIPLLITLIFGIIEFGLLLYDKGIITHAAREGARVGVVFNVGTDPGADNRIPIINITDKVNYYIANRLVSFAPGMQDPDITISLFNPAEVNLVDTRLHFVYLDCVCFYIDNCESVYRTYKYMVLIDQIKPAVVVRTQFFRKFE